MVNWGAWETGGLIFDAFSGLLYLFLGIAVLFVRPLTRPARWFAAFAIIWGADHIVRNLMMLLSSEDVAFMYQSSVGTISRAIIGIILWRIVHVWPTPADSAQRRVLRMMTLVAVIIAAGAMASFLQRVIELAPSIGSPVPWLIAILFVGEIIFYIAGAYFLMALAWRFQAASKGSEIRLVAISFGLYFSLLWADFMEQLLQRDQQYLVIPFSIAVLVGVLGISSWLILSIRLPTASEGRQASSVSLVLLGTMLFGFLFAIFVVPADINWANLGLFGLVRTIAIAMLGYAIVKHQLFGLDVKIKLAISKGTVAAIFLAVFAVVSLAASEWLVDRFGYIFGAVAAGAMLLAFKPIQSFGERVAAAAMPNAKPIGERSSNERLDMYRDLLASAWSDGIMTRGENRMLETARERLGLTAAQANRVDKEFHGN